MGYAKPVNVNPLSRWGVYPSGRTHRAFDYPVPVGTRIQAGMAGVVTTAGWSSTGFGNQIRIKFDDGNTAIYAHLSRFAVKVGQRVTKRQTIGYSGNTGNSTGPHLHWEIRKSSWLPLTAWNFTSYIEPYAAPTDAPTVTTPYFNRTLLKYKARNSEVQRFQKWLWSKQGTGTKAWFASNVYNFTTKGYTTLYGDSTARLVQVTYQKLHEANPKAGWDRGVVNGVWPKEPGPGLFKHYGARSN